jgi:UDP-N-acetylmuramyl pentapeptide phosphotransferase/UDP-N-acetylglucosamine-1-phosphate transferase
MPFIDPPRYGLRAALTALVHTGGVAIVIGLVVASFGLAQHGRFGRSVLQVGLALIALGVGVGLLHAFAEWHDDWRARRTPRG